MAGGADVLLGRALQKLSDGDLALVRYTLNVDAARPTPNTVAAASALLPGM